MKFFDWFRKNTLVKFAVSAAIAAAAVFIIGIKVGWPEILGIFGALDPAFIALAAILYGVTLFFRAIRFYFFFRGSISIRELSRVVAIHSFWNNFLPFRAGEFSYLYLIKKYSHVTDGENVVSLLVARAFDAVIVLFALFASSLFLFSYHQVFSRSLLITVFFGVVFLSGGVLFFVFIRKRSRELAKRSIIFLEGRLPKFLVFFLFKLREALAALGSLRSRSRLGIFFLLSCLVWTSDLLSVWSAFAAGGAYLRPAEAVFMAAFPVFATLIPFQTPLGLGTFEATIASGLFLLGVPIASALRASVYLHAQFLFFSVIAFLSSHRIRKSGAPVIS